MSESDKVAASPNNNQQQDEREAFIKEANRVLYDTQQLQLLSDNPLEKARLSSDIGHIKDFIETLETNRGFIPENYLKGSRISPEDYKKFLEDSKNYLKQVYDVSELKEHNPYLGLKAYGYEDREKYSGYKEEIEIVYNKIFSTENKKLKIFFITGASGCGKSSFVMAGLIPEVEKRFKQGLVQFSVMRPSLHPVANLKTALKELGFGSTDEPNTLQEFQKFFENLATSEVDQTRIRILVIDQFEEVFIEASTNKLEQERQTEAEVFCEAFAKLPDLITRQLYFIATIRSDYLSELINNFDIQESHYVLPKMDETQLKKAIEQPILALNKNKQLNKALVSDLAKQTSEDAGYLPLLQLTLEKIWDTGSLHPDSNPKITEALPNWANQIYQYELEKINLSPNKITYYSNKSKPRSDELKAEMLTLLLELVRVPTWNKGVHVNVRRSVERSFLEKKTTHALQLIEELTGARLLTIEEETEVSGKVDVVRIIHESLLNHWPVLLAAIKENSELLQKRERFEKALDDWLAYNKSKDKLLIGGELEEARTLLEKKVIEFQELQGKPVAVQEFLMKSEELAIEEINRLKRQIKDQKRANKLLLWLFVVVTSAALTIGIFLWNATEPERTRETARNAVLLIEIPDGPANVGLSENRLAMIDPKANRGTDETDGTIMLKRFWLEQYEVTNKRYKLCVDLKICTVPSDQSSLERFINQVKYGDYPVTGVSALQAYQFCRWIGRRLPNAVEWERAARGTPGTSEADLWPWGNENPLNLSANPPIDLDATEPSPVGKHAKDTILPTAKSGRNLDDNVQPDPRISLYDMAGNAREWTASYYNWQSNLITNGVPDLGHFSANNPNLVWNGESRILFNPNGTPLNLNIKGVGWKILTVRALQPSLTLITRSTGQAIYFPDQQVGIRCAADTAQ